MRIKLYEEFNTEPSDKAGREIIANDIDRDLKIVMENLCGLGRSGYDKVDDWHKGILDLIKKGNNYKELRSQVSSEIDSNLKAIMENLCGLARDGYDKVDDWHKGILDSIRNHKF